MSSTIKQSLLGLLIVVILFLTAPLSSSFADEPVYYHATIESSINPVTAGYLKRSISKAEKENAHALILQLDTPGGLMQSMNEMTDAMLNTELPVIVWVGPAGARATSAGVFITYASHLASMAEGTRIGAAHPVSGGGQSMSETMQEKVTNDAVAQLKSLGRKRGRNVDLADSFVRRSVSLIAEDAVERNVVAFLSNSLNELITELDGRTLTVSGDETVTLREGKIQQIPMNAKENFLNTLVNPNLVYLLLTIGLYGLIYEFAQPGVGLGATVGGVCLILALYGMSVLPINYAGLGLLGLGIGLMMLDIFVPSFGVLTMGGLTSFVLGSVFLFKTQAFEVSLGLIVGVTSATFTFVLIAGYLILGAFTLPVAIGDDSMVGREGTVKEDLDPEGMVYVHGEYWSAKSEDGSTISKNESIEVTKKGDRKLTVKKS